jgi:hypothetical protein
MHAYLMLGLELMFLALVLHVTQRKPGNYKIAGQMWGLYQGTPPDPPAEGTDDAAPPPVVHANVIHGPDCKCSVRPAAPSAVRYVSSNSIEPLRSDKTAIAHGHRGTGSVVVGNYLSSSGRN